MKAYMSCFFFLKEREVEHICRVEGGAEGEQERILSRLPVHDSGLDPVTPVS